MSQENICKLNKFGYCKYENRCFRKHQNAICENVQCSITECSLRHPRKCRYFLEFLYCKFGNYCRFSHKTLKNKENTKDIEELREELKQLEEKIQEKDNEIKIKDMKIKVMEDNFEKEKKNIEQEELEKFEIVRNEWHVTQMLFDSFKEEMLYKYGYVSNEETSEEEIDNVDEKVTESEKRNCNMCDFKGKTEK